jgi:hypothetical protein
MKRTLVSALFIYVDMKPSAVRSVYVPYLLFFPCSFFHLFQTMKIIIEINVSAVVILKVLSNGTGGGVWVVSIDRPLNTLHFRRF